MTMFEASELALKEPSAGTGAATPRYPWARLPENWKRYGVRTAALGGALLLWHVLSATKFSLGIHFENVPGPLDVFGALFELLRTEGFYVDVAVSLRRIGISYGLAAGLGVLLGVLMGRSRLVEDVFKPYVEIIRPIPAVAWIPLAILMWPTEESSIMFITFLGAFFPIVLNTVHGVEQTPEVLVRAALSLGASRRAVFWEVVLPGALPSISTGFAIGMGVCWFSLLTGEIISGQYGIGYFTWKSYSLMHYPHIIIGMLTIGSLGALSTYGVRLITRPLLRWNTGDKP